MDEKEIAELVKRSNDLWEIIGSRLGADGKEKLAELIEIQNQLAKLDNR